MNKGNAHHSEKPIKSGCVDYPDCFTCPFKDCLWVSEQVDLVRRKVERCKKIGYLVRSEERVGGRYGGL